MRKNPQTRTSLGKIWLDLHFQRREVSFNHDINFISDEVKRFMLASVHNVPCTTSLSIYIVRSAYVSVMRVCTNVLIRSRPLGYRLLLFLSLLCVCVIDARKDCESGCVDWLLLWSHIQVDVHGHP